MFKEKGEKNLGIKKQRELLNISQVDLAKKIGVSQGMISQWENGDFLPRAERLPMLAKVLKCTVDDLLKEDE